MDNKLFSKVEGVAETLCVYEDKLSITPRGALGFLYKGMKGTKEIPFSSINAIQLKLAGFITNGYIQFTISGGKESRGGLFDAAGDENTFFFKKAVNEAIQKIKQYIQDKNKHSKNPATGPMSKADELSKLVTLKASGAISEEEFEKLKGEIMMKAS